MVFFFVLTNFRMKEVQIGEVKILLSRVAGKYYATGLKCSHFGAPLNKGTLQRTYTTHKLQVHSLER